MLSTRREQTLIISGLISLNLLLAWQLESFWKDYRSRTRWLSQGVTPQRQPTPLAGSSKPGQPQNFVDIVDRDVFSPLRGNAPAQAQEEAKAPKLPYLYGTMDLGSGRFALMSPGDQFPPLSKRVLPGEEIGGYKLASIGASNVVLEWQGKKITVEITPPATRGPTTVERTASVRTGPGVPPNVPSPVNIVSPDSAAGTSTTTGRAGQPGAPPDVPLGAVVDGKRKVQVPSPFGPLVQWQQVNPNGAQTPQQAGAPNK